MTEINRKSYSPSLTIACPDKIVGLLYFEIPGKYNRKIIFRRDLKN